MRLLLFFLSFFFLFSFSHSFKFEGVWVIYEDCRVIKRNASMCCGMSGSTLVWNRLNDVIYVMSTILVNARNCIVEYIDDLGTFSVPGVLVNETTWTFNNQLFCSPYKDEDPVYHNPIYCSDSGKGGFDAPSKAHCIAGPCLTNSATKFCVSLLSLIPFIFVLVLG